VLRDHLLFRTPLAIDVKKTEAMSTPAAFRPALRQDKIDVVPLVADSKAAHDSGWCTYTYEHDDAPELEVLCGGINSKTPKAGAIWRQGNLLHFGFEPSPDRMSDAGKALLINAICYISRFTEDRPIVHTPCVFIQGKRIYDRGVIGRVLANADNNLAEELKYFLDKELFTQLGGKSRKEVGEWYEHVRGYLHAGANHGLSVDGDARSLGTPPASSEFLEKTLLSLADPKRAALARNLLGRYVPEGPGSDAPAEKWRSWARDHKPYLFFSDAGGYRWYLDPLAKRRSIPTERLRGPARATLPGLTNSGAKAGDAKLRP
jgi:hypothetical protein